MKKILRWLIVLLAVFIVLVVALIFSINPIAKSFAVKKIRAETGMEPRIGHFDLSLLRRSIHIKDLKLMNPPDFGGGIFLSFPELYVEVEVDKIKQTDQLHLKNVRVNLGELHLIEDKNGRRNLERWQKTDKDPTRVPEVPPPDPGAENSRSKFGGIQRLEVSLGRVHFTSERNPKENFDRDVGLKNRVFDNIQTEQQLKAVSVILAVQCGLKFFE